MAEPNQPANQPGLGGLREAMAATQVVRVKPADSAPAAALAPAPGEEAKPKLDAQGRAYATGKR